MKRNAGGRRSTTWPKGKKPPVKKPKGSKHKKTLFKQAVGIGNWNELGEYIRKEGAGKMILELKKLRGKSYQAAYSGLLEYFEPKKSRVEASVKGDISISRITHNLIVKKCDGDVKVG